MTALRQSSYQRCRQFLNDFQFSKGTSRRPPAHEATVSLRDLARYRGWLTPHFRGVAEVLLLSLLSMAAEIVWPLAYAQLIDHVVLNDQLDLREKTRLLALGGLAVCLALTLKWALSWLRAVRLKLHTSRLGVSLRRKLFHHLLRLPLADVYSLRSSGAQFRVGKDVDDANELLQSAVLIPLVAGVRMLVLLTSLFLLDYRIAIVAAGSIAAILYWRTMTLRRLRPLWRTIAEDRQELTALVGESVSGLPVVRAFARERSEELAFTLTCHTEMRKDLHATNITGALSVVGDLLLPALQVAILCCGGYLIARGQLTMGKLLAVQNYTQYMFEPLRQLMDSIGSLQRGVTAAERVHGTLAKPLDKVQASDAVPAPQTVEELQFEHVSFSYIAGSEVIHDFNLRIRGGTMVALTGPSGAGKTTLCSLLARFHDPTAGTIRLNGIDLRRLQLQSYRSLVGIVPQEPFLFDRSVRDNIAYGRPDATLEQIERAAQRAHAHDFIQRLPQKYDSVVGERGFTLSGGQRQRLVIARAFLVDPSILILDEATSNLDTESERLIQASMSELVKGRTTLIIAHRLSTLTSADQIVVVDQGRILEQGTHGELVRNRSMYYQLLRSQSQADRRSEAPAAAPPSSMLLAAFSPSSSGNG